MFLPSLPRNVEASFRDLGSQKADTRRSAMADVVRHALGDAALRTRAIPLIEKRLRDDEVAEVRAAAAVALTDLRAHEALSSLLLSVEDAHPMVRQMAINALGEIGDARGEARLLRALKDERPEVRYQALIAYARVAKDGDDAVRALATALNDIDEAIQHIALRVAEERVDAHAEVPQSFRDRAKKKLESSHPDVAAAAAILLGKLGDESAKGVLSKIVTGAGINGRMPGKEEEAAAVELVGALGYAELGAELARRAWGLTRHFRDTCAFSAKVALAAMGDPRATTEVLVALDERNATSRRNAIAACGRAKLERARAKLEAMKDGEDADLVKEALAQIGIGPSAHDDRDLPADESASPDRGASS